MATRSESDDACTKAGIRIHQLRAVEITRSNFAAYGELVEPVDDGCEGESSDASLDLTEGTPRLYIMRTRDRSVRVKGVITHHARVTQCLGSITPRPWYLAVAPASLVDLDVAEKRQKNEAEAEEKEEKEEKENSSLCDSDIVIIERREGGGSAHAYRPPKAEDVKLFRIDGIKFVKLHKGTWHEGPLYDGGVMDFYNLELSDTNVKDFTSYNFREQDGVEFEIVHDDAT